MCTYNTNTLNSIILLNNTTYIIFTHVDLNVEMSGDKAHGGNGGRLSRIETTHMQGV